MGGGGGGGGGGSNASITVFCTVYSLGILENGNGLFVV
jgi:hypothetical protein